MKNKIYYALALTVLIVPLFLAKASAADQPPTLKCSGYQLKSKGSISYERTQNKAAVRFCSNDLYQIAEEINLLETKIK